MGKDTGLKKIVVTGPESTGKTTLSESIALELNAEWIPEYARGYIGNLSRPYTYQDVEKIGQYQICQEKEISETTKNGILVMDTWLIITKVWFEVVYCKSPDWLNDYLSAARIDLFLVCSPDLPWMADPVRENGGEMRKKLFNRYCEEIKSYGFQYEVVEGFGEVRMRNAFNFLKLHHIE